MKFLMTIGATVFGSLGWWLGSKISIYMALLFSTVGGLVGIYAVYKIHEEFL